MENKGRNIVGWTLIILICTVAIARPNLQYYTETLFNTFTNALDTNHNGNPTDDTWYITFDGKISSLAEDPTPELNGPLDQNGNVIREANATAFTDSDAPSPDLSSAHQIITFADDGTADVTTLTGFSNIPIGVVYSAEFTDALWEVDFSGTNLEGHGGNDWSPRAGDSMSFYTTDGTTIVCTISAPTSLSISAIYKLPLATVAAMVAGSNYGASGIIDTVTIDSGVSSSYSTCLMVDTDGEYILADADALATAKCTALAIEDGQGSKKVLKYGRFRDDSKAWTVGGAIYLSATDGALTQTQVSSGDFNQKVGYAEHADVMFFAPDPTITEVP